MTLIERIATSPLNYRATLIADPLAALAFAIYGAAAYDGAVFSAIVFVVIGFMAWGLLEYALHRWLLHGVLAAPRREHAKHHGAPTAMVSTPLLVVPIGAFVIYLTLALLLQSGVAALITFGIYAGYNYFAIVHHLLHHRHDALARSRWFEAQVRLHDAHHLRPDLHFGISSGLWDRLFGTFPQDEQVVMKQSR
jgi:sterol desaturase/sphingolipid hydroxylase (fatty acid hydroxylase superfamily)